MIPSEEIEHHCYGNASHQHFLATDLLRLLHSLIRDVFLTFAAVHEIIPQTVSYAVL